MATRSVVLTIDIGLTNCKVSCFDTTGAVVAQASERYATHQPAPGQSEQEPAAWWGAVVRGMARLHAENATHDWDILAISVTGHMHALVGLDRSGKPVTSCWTLFDQRARREAAEIQAHIGEAHIYAQTGARLEAYTPAAKIRWLQRNQPQIFAQVQTFVSPKDALRIRLGGDICTDPVDAAGMLLVDLAKGTWSAQLREICGLAPDQLPEIRLPWSAAGKMDREAAAALDIAEGTPIVTGAGDDVETLGAGIARAGSALEHLGTTGTLVICTDSPYFDPDRRLEVYPHVVPGMFLVGGATNAAGLSLDWALRLLRLDGDHTGQLPLQLPLSEGRPPLYLPYLRGERGLLWNPQATGSLLGLRDTHGPLDLAYAIHEGVAFSIKEILTAIRGLGIQVLDITTGTPPDDYGWSALRSSAYRMPLHLPAAGDLTGLGAALLALVGQSVYPSLMVAVERCCANVGAVQGDPGIEEFLTRRYDLFQTAVKGYRPLLGLFEPE